MMQLMPEISNLNIGGQCDTNLSEYPWENFHLFIYVKKQIKLCVQLNVLFLLFMLRILSTMYIIIQWHGKLFGHLNILHVIYMFLHITQFNTCNITYGDKVS